MIRQTYKGICDILFFGSILLIMGCSEMDISKYVSLEDALRNDTQNDLYKYDKETYSKNKANLISVLVYYKVPVELSIYREVLIPPQFINDKEYLWNLYYKATDSVWMNRHLFLSSDSIEHLK